MRLFSLGFLSFLALAVVTGGSGEAFGQAPQATAGATTSGAGAALDGIWVGSLTVGGQTLRVQMRLRTGAGVEQKCVFDSVDQKAFGIPCGPVEVKGETLTVAVPAVSGSWSGHLSGDGKTLQGTWTQGASLLLNFTRQTVAMEGPKVEAPAMDAAMAPVGVTEIKAVLDKDLAAALAKGDLAAGTGGGVTIGVVQGGVRRIFSYGTAKPDSIFEIGSITKTFTGLLLAQMAAQGRVSLETPVRELLPPGTVAKPAGGETRLVDISDQHSGFPRMPDNFHPAAPENPYADYDAKMLYAFVAKHGVARAADAPFQYSNVAMGLLGQALANKAGMPYGELLRRQVLGPLGMNETAIALTPEMRARFIEGHDAEHHPAHAWDLDALAGAGGLRSSAADMLTYLEAQLHPGRLARGDVAAGALATLPGAIAATHVVRADVGGGMHIGLNWFRIDETGSFWHNGGTGGYSSYALFNPEKDFGLVVLFNGAPDGFADKLGAHVAQRLSGRAAVSLGAGL